MYSRWSLRLRLLCRRHWYVCLPVLAFLGIILPYVGTIPVMDGFAYWECLYAAIERPFHFRNFICYAHPTILYMLLFGITQYIDFGSVVLLNGLSIVLVGLSGIAFYACILFLFPKNRLLAALLTIPYICHPVLLANVVDFNLDTGITIFFVFLICSLLYHIPWLTILSGLFLCFTKETGVMLYVLTVGTYEFLFTALGSFSLREKIRIMLRHTTLLIPIIAFVAYYCTLKYYLEVPPLWHDVSQSFFRSFFDLHFTHRHLILLAMMFVLQFLWIQSSIITLAVCRRLVRLVVQRPSSADLHMPPARVVIFVLTIFLFTTYFMTRFSTFNNARYYLSVYLLTSVVFAIGLHYAFMKKTMRLAVASGVAALTILSAFRSVDPISRKIFGTMTFGSRTLYPLAVASEDYCCGLGRDQLIYNLEYTHLLSLLEKTFKEMQAGETTVFVTSGYVSSPDFFGPLDPHTFRRTEKRTGTFRPKHFDVHAVLAQNPLPEKIHFIRFPHFPDFVEFEMLHQKYDSALEWKVEEDGYALTVIEMTLHP